MTRLTWICHGATAANRQARFPLDEPLEKNAFLDARSLASHLQRADRVLTSPTLRARQTAGALALGHEDAPDLADCDYGDWAGLSIAELQQSQPDKLAAWMAQPESAPHGGETIAAILTRTERWMADQSKLGGHVIAISHAAVIKAALLVTLKAPPSSFWLADIEPLAIVRMTSNGSRWSVRLPVASS